MKPVNRSEQEDLGTAVLQLRHGRPNQASLLAVAAEIGTKSREVIRAVSDSAVAVETLLENAQCRHGAVQGLAELVADREEPAAVRMALADILRHKLDSKTSTVLAVVSEDRQKRRVVLVDDEDTSVSRAVDPLVSLVVENLAEALMSACLGFPGGSRLSFALADAFLSLARASRVFTNAFLKPECIRRLLEHIVTWYDGMPGSELLCAGLLSLLLCVEMNPSSDLFALASRSGIQPEPRAKVLASMLHPKFNGEKSASESLIRMSLFLGQIPVSRRRKLMLAVPGFRDGVLEVARANPACGLALLDQLGPIEVHEFTEQFILGQLVSGESTLEWNHLARAWLAQCSTACLYIVTSSATLAEKTSLFEALVGKNRFGWDDAFREFSASQESGVQALLFECVDWNPYREDEAFWLWASHFEKGAELMARLVVENPGDTISVSLASKCGPFLSKNAFSVLRVITNRMRDQTALSAEILSGESSTAVQTLLLERLSPLLVIRVLEASVVAEAASEELICLLTVRMESLYEFPQVRQLASEAMSKMRIDVALHQTGIILDRAQTQLSDESGIVATKAVLLTWTGLAWLHGNVFQQTTLDIVWELLASFPEPASECLAMIALKSPEMLESSLELPHRQAQACQIATRVFKRPVNLEPVAKALLPALLQCSDAAALGALFQLVVTCPETVHVYYVPLFDAVFAATSPSSSLERQIRGTTLLGALLTVEGAPVTPTLLAKSMTILQSFGSSAHSSLRNLAASILSAGQRAS